MHSSLCAIRKVCISILAVTLLPLAFSTEVVTAQTRTISFKPPKSGAPKTTTGAATRDGQTCLNDSSQANNQTLPILPRSNYGLTISSRPEFLIFKTKSSAQKIFFSLESEDGEQAFQTFVPLSSSDAGFVTINFPNDAPDLIANKKYKWTMTFICGKALRPDSPAITGWIQHTPKSQILATKLQAASAFDRVVIYGENGIWYDMINELNGLRRKSPNNQTLSESWEKLLKEHVIQSSESVSPVQ